MSILRKAKVAQPKFRVKGPCRRSATLSVAFAITWESDKSLNAPYTCFTFRLVHDKLLTFFGLCEISNLYGRGKDSTCTARIFLYSLDIKKVNHESKRMFLLYIAQLVEVCT